MDSRTVSSINFGTFFSKVIHIVYCQNFQIHLALKYFVITSQLMTAHSICNFSSLWIPFSSYIFCTPRRIYLRALYSDQSRPGMYSLCNVLLSRKCLCDQFVLTDDNHFLHNYSTCKLKKKIKIKGNLMYRNSLRCGDGPELRFAPNF